jgi:hypothetical protein
VKSKLLPVIPISRATSCTRYSAASSPRLPALNFFRYAASENKLPCNFRSAISLFGPRAPGQIRQLAPSVKSVVLSGFKEC